MFLNSLSWNEKFVFSVICVLFLSPKPLDRLLSYSGLCFYMMFQFSQSFWNLKKIHNGPLRSDLVHFCFKKVCHALSLKPLHRFISYSGLCIYMMWRLCLSCWNLEKIHNIPVRSDFAFLLLKKCAALYLWNRFTDPFDIQHYASIWFADYARHFQI